MPHPLSSIPHGATETLRSKIFSLLVPIFAAFLSGTLFVLAFPGYDIGWLGWVALVPLLVAIFGKSSKFGFFLAFIFGVVFCAGIFSFIFEVHGYTFLHHLLIALYLGPLFGLFGLAFSFISRRLSAGTALLAAPLLFVSFEFIRANLGFLALPWGFLAHSQHSFLPIIQIAAVTGAYSVSFLVALVNSTIAAVILRISYLLKEHKHAVQKPLSRQAMIWMVFTSAALTILAVLYGEIVLSKPTNSKNIKVAVVQGNIEQSKKWDPKYADFIMQKYSDLTREASKDRPDLIVWPEASTPGLVLLRKQHLMKIMSLGSQLKSHLLIGSSEYSKFSKELRDKRKTGNTALFFSSEGKVVGQYLKIHLVPFGEYVPYEDTIPWPSFIVPEHKKTFTIAGNDFTLFQVKMANFGVVICWESLFPDLFRKFIKGGANLMVNITNEGRYGKTAAPYQLLSMTLFRAVENRVSIARAANTGISCFIDPYGRIIAKVQEGDMDTFVEGYLTREIPLSRDKSFYTTHGYVFIYVVLCLALVMIAFSLVRPKRE